MTTLINTISKVAVSNLKSAIESGSEDPGSDLMEESIMMEEDDKSEGCPNFPESGRVDEPDPGHPVQMPLFPENESKVEQIAEHISIGVATTCKLGVLWSKEDILQDIRDGKIESPLKIIEANKDLQKASYFLKAAKLYPDDDALYRETVIETMKALEVEEFYLPTPANSKQILFLKFEERNMIAMLSGLERELAYNELIEAVNSKMSKNDFSDLYAKAKDKYKNDVVEQIERQLDPRRGWAQAEEKEEEVELEIRSYPTLKEISENTENFTLFEKEPGYLHRIINPNDENSAVLNSKLICRVRYLIREAKEDFLYKTKMEFHKMMNVILRKAYEECYPDEYYDKNASLYEIRSIGSLNDSEYEICLSTGPNLVYVLMRIFINSGNVNFD